MPEDTAVVFTLKSVERILREGGSSSWRLDPSHARRCTYVVCTRNSKAKIVEGPEEHQSAFLVGKVMDVVPAPWRMERYLILFSEYALLNTPKVWQGDRNPVRYASIGALGIDPSALDWKPMPESKPSRLPEESIAASASVGALTLIEAKKGLALTFGVSQDAIEITIRA
jgi:hypothetical protein